ncbi:hypothetical protein ACWEPL_38780 [Nonomuraea sp. NPDC004186]
METIYATAVLSGGDQALVSFMRSDRERSPFFDRTEGRASVFVRTDSSHPLGATGIDEKQDVGRGQRSPLA